MASIQELASVVRSKNAGPFQITIDILFADNSTYRKVLHSGVLSADVIGALYGVPSQLVKIIPFEKVKAIKVTLPRVSGDRGSGSAFDRDVYGAQQHGPVAQIEVG